MLVEDFAQQLYLPRLAGPTVLTDALRSGIGLLTWRMDTFAHAESFDESSGRYRGLRGGELVAIAPYDSGLIVKPDIAGRQIDADTPEPPPGGRPGISGTQGAYPGTTHDDPSPPVPALNRRYHGTVRLDPTRVGRDASEIAEEAIAHLVGLDGAEVTVTIDIEARLPEGASEQVVRTVTENGRTLKFEPGSGFETE